MDPLIPQASADGSSCSSGGCDAGSSRPMQKAATLERVRGVLGHGGRSGADGSGGGRDSEAEEGGEEGGMDFASKMRARVAAKRKALGKVSGAFRSSV